MADKMTAVQHDPTKTMSIPDAGKKYFNLGRNASYTAAKLGYIPTLDMGRKKVAVVPAIERMIAEAGTKKSTIT